MSHWLLGLYWLCHHRRSWCLSNCQRVWTRSPAPSQISGRL